MVYHNLLRRPKKFCRDRLRELHAAGWTDKELAAEFRVTVAAVHEARAKLGLGPNARKPWTYRQIAQLKAWTEAGVPQDEQARRLGRTYCSVAGALRKHGLTGVAPYRDRGVNTRAAVLDGIGKGLGRPEIASLAGLHPDTITHTAGQLIAEGLVERAGRGRWRLLPKWYHTHSRD